MESSLPVSPTMRDTVRAGDAVAGPGPIPALRGYPVLGSLLRFQRDRLGLLDELGRLGPVSRFDLGPVPIHVVNDGALAHALLVDHADAVMKERTQAVFLRPLLGQGLLTSEAGLHRRQRKLLAPAFAPKRLASYAQTMTGEAVWTLASWRDGEVVDVSAAMMEMTLAIAGRTLFSADVRGDARVVGSALHDAMASMLASMSSLVQVPYEWPLPRHRKMRRAVAALDQIVFRLIDERRRDGGDAGDVLSALIAARDEDGAAMDDRQIRDEVMTFILAGHETTANALSWALYALGRHGEVAAALHAEVDALGGRMPTLDDLPQLPYALMIVEEAMRLWPPAYVLGRQILRDVSIGGYRFPAGAVLFINTWGLHRNPGIYEAPYVFRPERFAPEAKKARPRGWYLPFGAGPRVCIGGHFALVEAQLALATIAASVRLTPVGTVEPEPLMTLRPRGGLPMRVARRA